MSITLTVDDKKTLERALDCWGEEAQIGMAYEELGELITALNHFKRGRIGEYELASEVADVLIMVNQLSILVGPQVVQDQIVFKMDRLRQRLRAFTQP